MTSELEKKVERLKEKRKSKIHRVYMKSLDEIEIETPTQVYVLGIDGDGYMVIGRTGWSPRFIETQTIKDHTIRIPRKLIHELKIGEGTKFVRAKIYAIGRDILIRPIKIPPKWDGRHCSYCGMLIEDASRRKKPCTIRWLGIRFAFCSKEHRGLFRKEKIGKGELKYEDLCPNR